MIFIRSINLRACVRACVRAGMHISMRAFRSRFDASRASRDVDSRYCKYYTRGQPRKHWPFPNAECNCRTCVDSDLEVRLPGRTTRPLRSAQREGRVSCLLRYILENCACEKDKQLDLICD